MKKGFAVEGFLREDGTVKPLVGYDDTELREKIQKNTDDIDNLDSRVDAIEGSLGLEPLSFWINRETLAVRDEDKPALVEFVKDYIHKGGVVCNVYFYTLGQNDSIGGYTYSCTAYIYTPTPINTSGSIFIAVGNIYYALSFSYDTSAGEVTLGTTWTRGVKEVDDVPTADSEKFLTSGAIKAALDGKSFISYSGDYGEASISLEGDQDTGAVVEIGVKDGDNDVVYAYIDADNIGNLNRALNTPSYSPEDNANKLITSKAVYDTKVALESKIDSLRILSISYIHESEEYSLSTGDKTNITAFIQSVQLNTHVPVVVGLYQGGTLEAKVLGLAHWKLVTDHDIYVEIVIGKYKFSVQAADVSSMSDWTRTIFGQDII